MMKETTKIQMAAFVGAATCCVLLLGGCGGPAPVDVGGKVYFGKEVINGFETGRVTYHNTEGKSFPGELQKSGDYSLTAPPGRYKVTVIAEVPSDPKDEYSSPRSIIPRAYGDKNKTRVEIEVKESGDNYDIKLLK